MISLYVFKPSWSTMHWFNLSGPCFLIRYAQRRTLFFWLWNAFNRVTADGDHWWGVGILQIGKRHLCYIGHNGVSLFFIGVTD